MSTSGSSGSRQFQGGCGDRVYYPKAHIQSFRLCTAPDGDWNGGPEPNFCRTVAYDGYSDAVAFPAW